MRLLTTRQVVNAIEGDLADGGGLVLRVAGERASWVLRYTAPSGKRREMGLAGRHRAQATVQDDGELGEVDFQTMRKPVPQRRQFPVFLG